MIFLLDTNVISELRRTKPHGAVLAWFQDIDQIDIAIPAIVLGELQAGVEITRRQDPIKAAGLEAWINEISLTMAVLPMDGSIAREWARIMEGKTKSLSEDAMIAATARIHGLNVVTRNTRDFEPFKVDIFNPFTSKS